MTPNSSQGGLVTSLLQGLFGQLPAMSSTNQTAIAAANIPAGTNQAATNRLLRAAAANNAVAAANNRAALVNNRVLQQANAVNVANNATVSRANNNQAVGPPTDDFARQIEAVWKGAFPDATILPVAGMPSTANGVATLTHSMGDSMPKLKIDGLTSLSPLANNALISAEVSNGKWLNLYEIMLPDTPGVDGGLSAGQRYASYLQSRGISVAGSHYHWAGMEPFMIAVHSQNVGMDPRLFAQHHIEALRLAIA